MAVLASNEVASILDHTYDGRTRKTHVRVETNQFTNWFYLTGKYSPSRALKELTPLIKRKLGEFGVANPFTSLSQFIPAKAVHVEQDSRGRATKIHILTKKGTADRLGLKGRRRKVGSGGRKNPASKRRVRNPQSTFLQGNDVTWALETHTGKRDTGRYKSAILFGNEDAPEWINFYTVAEPKVNTKISWKWTPKD